MAINKWTKEQLATLTKWYSERNINEYFRLDDLAKILKKHKSNVSRKARELCLSNRHRQKRVKVIEFTKYNTKEERFAAIGNSTKNRIKNFGHPRGMLGKKHSDKIKELLSEKSKAMWKDPNSKVNSPENYQRMSDEMMKRRKEGKMRNGYTRCHGGKRSDLGDMFFRSSWEANYARYLNWCITRGEVLSWQYESKTFIFEKIKRGTRSYTPDFKVFLPGENGKYEWHEVKGWMDPKSKVKLKRMEIYFPEETIKIIDKTFFNQAKRTGLSSMIQNWES